MVKASDIVKVKVMKVDLQRKRIALSMRLDEQPCESSARRGGNPAVPAQNNISHTAAKTAKPRSITPTGNSAIGDALSAAFGKKR